MNERKNIILFDGSFKTTAFIRRLTQALVKKHNVYILGFDETDPQKVLGVTYIGLGTSKKPLLLVLKSIYIAIKSLNVEYIIKLPGLIVNKRLFELKKRNTLIEIKKIGPSLIHLQWPSLIPLFEELIEEKSTKIILSLRGTQVNVKPFIDDKNYAYLKEWFPKLDGFHAVSKLINAKAKEFSKHHGVIDKVVYSGLDLDKFEFNSNVKEHEQLNIISVGRVHWIKGYNYALEACKLLKELDIAFQYRLIGVEGDEELLYLIHHLGLQEHVLIEPLLKQHEVKSKITQADVLLLPSIEEGIANVVLEAMALGTPVISTNCGGMAEVIDHNTSGWLIPKRDPKAIANQLSLFNIMTVDHIKEIKKNARKKIEQQHTEGHMISGMLELYGSVLAS
ncbi:hypothetical protein GCM10009117_03710 [Gangjinia marincola]|uniref:Glycosyl transferase family 1 domain-containing protein n=1 Tax=Gangjinia marincola TaxID=578463 RepID=A0ABN1MDY8_9FLAO